MSRFTPDELERAIALLSAIAEDRSLLAGVPEDRRRALLMAAGRVSRPNRDEVRRMSKAMRRLDRAQAEAHDRELVADTEIRSARRADVFVPPSRMLGEGATERELETPRDCYVCKEPYKKLHFFYDSMCPACAAFNYEKRFQSAPLDGKVALITGARVKIGYQAALMMLRAGAHVIVTTRFPRDAAQRYAREPDFARWRPRLEIHGLDLRHAPNVEAFARHLCATRERLDILINNAAQTVRRPAGFYAHLADMENQRLPELEQFAGLVVDHPQEETTENDALVFPPGQIDADLQQIDLRTTNSWRLRLAEVPSAEMLEVQLVNAVAPFILCAKLKPLMLKTDNRDKHVVNVSAMEGQFNRGTKTDKHPHTNMAKAALNMMTLTSAPDYARDGIFMNAVDTGWVTDEDPVVLSKKKQERHDFQPPLDIVDGAARVCDPFFSGLLTGEHVYGKFLKDYRECAW